MKIFKKSTSLILVVLLIVSLLMMGMSNVASDRHIKVIITFNQSPGQSEQALIKAFGGEIKYTYDIIPSIAATIPESAVNGLLRNPHILMIEPDSQVQADSEVLPWGVDRIDAELVQAAANNGLGINVAVLDTGIDYNHYDLQAIYRGGYDFVNGDDDPKDDNGHGTHVSGTIAATANNSAGVIGVAPGVNLYALKVLDSNGSGFFSDVISALQWCTERGIQITNNSYGSSTDPDLYGMALNQAFEESYAAGILHIASAGNEGKRTGKGDTVGYPAKYASVMAVAATDSSDARAYFSSTGDAVEIAAPGVSILSTYINNQLATMSGTSMASPHVAGVAALVMATGITDNVQVRQILQTSAEDLGVQGKDPWFGYGLVDAYKAVSGTVPPQGNQAPVVTIENPVDGSTFISGVPIEFTGTALDAEDGNLSDSLVWSSDIDGPIGTGSTVSAVLSEGIHAISAKVTDLGSLTDEKSITVTVQAVPVQEGSVTVTDVSYGTVGGKNGTAHLMVYVTLKDENSVPLSSTPLTIDLFLNDNLLTALSSTTDSAGTASFKYPNAPSGTYRSAVTSISSALIWDGQTPVNEFIK